jgi:hypothetical protein
MPHILISRPPIVQFYLNRTDLAPARFWPAPDHALCGQQDAQVPNSHRLTSLLNYFHFRIDK